MKRTVLFFFLGTTVLLSGCASVSVRPKHDKLRGSSNPDAFLVEDFHVDEATMRVDRTGEELRRFKQDLESQLSEDTTQALKGLGRPVGRTRDAKVHEVSRQSAWLVKGRVTSVEQGSRMLRSLIGFGAGRTKMETEVEIYDLTQSDRGAALMFQTSGGSGAEPGALISINPVMMVIKGTLTATNTGLRADSRRTARMIAAYISEALAAQGFLDQKSVRKAKVKL